MATAVAEAMEHTQNSAVGDTDPTPLSSFIMGHQLLVAPQAKGKLNLLLTSIAVSCKFVAQAVRKASGKDVWCQGCRGVGGDVDFTWSILTGLRS